MRTWPGVAAAGRLGRADAALVYRSGLLNDLGRVAAGRHASMTMHHYWRIRDGKVEHFRGSEDTELTARVFAA